MTEIDALEPAALWRSFAALTRIPRPSGGEAGVAQFLREWAHDHGFQCAADSAGNLVIDVPASAGAEGAAPVALQAHLDMVCEREPGVAHDFDSDPVDAYVDDGWVRARGTTLGADNGIGVAAAIAAASAPDAVRPPLQLLLTVEEETGMGGALALDAKLLRARRLMNLDSETDGEVTIGCAGGARVDIEVRPRWSAPAGAGATHAVSVGGLRGGHSGVQIHEGLGNAIVLLARVLDAARRDDPGLELVAFEGGAADNAIPRDARAALRSHRPEALEQAVQTVLGAARAELAAVDDRLTIELRRTDDAPARVLAAAERDRVIDLLLELPHGVLAMSEALPGLVETSANLGVVRTGEKTITIVQAPRSSSEGALDELLAQIAGSAERAGAAVVVRSRYPGWQPRPQTRLLELTRAAYRAVYGADPEVTAVHAGLECGALAQRLGELEMVSFGPEIRGAHSPAERVEIASVARFWRVLLRLLAELAR